MIVGPSNVTFVFTCAADTLENGSGNHFNPNMNKPSECNDVIRRAHVSRNARAAGYRTDRSRMGCFGFPLAKWEAKQLIGVPE